MLSFVYTALQSLVFGSSFVNYEPATVSDVASIFGVSFMVIVFVGVTYFQSSIPFTSMERAVFYREQVCTIVLITYFYISNAISNVALHVLSVPQESAHYTSHRTHYCS
jgi:FtsH-binding integral membrane protein